eukprot:6262934-Amphidinium_carterae.1
MASGRSESCLWAWLAGASWQPFLNHLQSACDNINFSQFSCLNPCANGHPSSCQCPKCAQHSMWSPQEQVVAASGNADVTVTLAAYTCFDVYSKPYGQSQYILVADRS